MERRTETQLRFLMGNILEHWRFGKSMGTKQQDIRTMSETHSRLETLIHHVNYQTLEAEHKKQLKHKAVGVDKVTKRTTTKICSAE